MKVIVYDDPKIWGDLRPLTLTRPVGALRVGIDTIADKWKAFLPGDYSWGVAEDYLAELFPAVGADESDTLFINGAVIPDSDFAAAVADVRPYEEIFDSEGTALAHRGPEIHFKRTLKYNAKTVRQLYDIFLLNGGEIVADMARITAGRTSQPLSATNTVVGDPSLIFIEEGATVEGVVINTRKGPVYVGRDAEIMEGSMLRGPIALCTHATVNMGTKVYPETTIGPHCKVGGEVNNVVFQGYSNKAHDGFLGNAVVGEWCNIGAGAVASNLKNDYTKIRVWNYTTRHFERTSLQFCGLMMGDHSKAGINTMFNTATVLGVGVNIHGAGFPRNFIESFMEGSTAGWNRVPEKKFFDIAERVMARRGRTMSEAERRMYIHLMHNS